MCADLAPKTGSEAPELPPEPPGSRNAPDLGLDNLLRAPDPALEPALELASEPASEPAQLAPKS